jgi:hypothetical protein
MDFMDISSLGAAYRYAVKIEQKFKHQNKREFGSANPQQPKYDKDNPNKIVSRKPVQATGKEGSREDKEGHWENGAISTKSPGTTLDECHSK